MQGGPVQSLNMVACSSKFGQKTQEGGFAPTPCPTPAVGCPGRELHEGDPPQPVAYGPLIKILIAHCASKGLIPSRPGCLAACVSRFLGQSLSSAPSAPKEFFRVLPDETGRLHAGARCRLFQGVAYHSSPPPQGQFWVPAQARPFPAPAIIHASLAFGTGDTCQSEPYLPPPCRSNVPSPHVTPRGLRPCPRR